SRIIKKKKKKQIKLTADLAVNTHPCQPPCYLLRAVYFVTAPAALIGGLCGDSRISGYGVCSLR
ncbi:hypothetical protein, partial [Burkholderia sp. Ac-20392]|uniref:hypothetical protein n=1 Tax=Burkholderia sp. Ac-20392 TaxID=2703905 RepID=UPI00198160F5